MSTRQEILKGLHDEELEDIEDAVRRRRRILGAQRFGTIEVGTKVRFISTIRPTYLAGAEATVVGKKVTKLMVRLAVPVGRFRGDLRVPASLVEVAE